MSDFEITPIRFNFSCFTCKQEFNLNFDYAVDKDHLACPNCGQKFNQKLLEELKTCVKNIDNVLSELHEQNSFKSGWSIKINWNDFEPEKPHAFSYLTTKSSRPKFGEKFEPIETCEDIKF